MSQNIFKTQWINDRPRSLSQINTVSCCNLGEAQDFRSPIDSCLNKIFDLNKTQTIFCLRQANDSSQASNGSLVIVLNNLIVLGYVSAVESYIREIIRRLIIVDKQCFEASQDKMLTLGAATYFDDINLLPEALLEKHSFISSKSVIDAFTSFLKITMTFKKGEKLEVAALEFEKICQLRHCITHRFGKLGSNNAIQLGLEKHSRLIEKPIALTDDLLESICQACMNFVLIVNQLLFDAIMYRSCKTEPSIWYWNYAKDRKSFLKYFNLFASRLFEQLPDAKTMYNTFRICGKKIQDGMRRSDNPSSS